MCRDGHAERDQELGPRHIAGSRTSVMQHDELAANPFKDAKGDESYGSAVDLLRPIDLEQRFEMYLGVQAWGTPEQILERLAARREFVGDDDLTACFRFAGLPIEDAERSMRTFATEVMPELCRDAVAA